MLNETTSTTVRVGARELDLALLPILAGNFELATAARSTFEASVNYASVLAGAEVAGFAVSAVNAGFIAGMIAAEQLANIRFEFLQTAAYAERQAAL